MSKILIATDFHITERSIPETSDILNEIYFANKRTKDVKELWILGDVFDKKNPLSSEIRFVTKIFKELLQKYKKIQLVIGNHEEISTNLSALDYLSNFNCKARNINIARKLIINNVYLGHTMLEESKYNYRDNPLKAINFKQYSKVFLGDQHSFQEIKKNIIHPGSIRYVTFAEVGDKNKYYLIYNTETNTYEKIPIKSAIKMYDVSSIKELDKLPEKSKVRLIINSLDHFKSVINVIPKYKEKFYQFKTKLDFKGEILKDQKPTNSKMITMNFEEKLVGYLKKNKVNKDIQKILLESFKEDKNG